MAMSDIGRLNTWGRERPAHSVKKAHSSHFTGVMVNGPDDTYVERKGPHEMVCWQDSGA